MSRDLILGTAGHIDHGKTSLVKALTGIDCDRLPEEKSRGITIDIGFATLDLGEGDSAVRLGIVDVPGHERFIKNMLAGATGIDLAMLVVAADDGLMPQTREHLEILKLLGVPAGVLVLTKCDLVDDATLDLLELDLRELVRGSAFESAPLVRTSTHTGRGVDELKRVVTEIAVAAVQRPAVDWFRMPIDRSFIVQGHGTVVTGSVLSGTLKVGDEIARLPSGEPVRVRSLQNHDRPVTEVHRGMRAAINIAGIDHHEIVRGQELATPGYLLSSRVVTVQLRCLAGMKSPIKHRASVRFHIGTLEVMGDVSLLDSDALAAGQVGLAQFFLEEPVTATWGQPFVVRGPSATQTLGGGHILQPVAKKIRRRHIEVLERAELLTSDDPHTRVLAAAWFGGFGGFTVAGLVRDASIPFSQAESLVGSLKADGTIRAIALPGGREMLVHVDAVSALEARILSSLGRLHASAPLVTSHERHKLVALLDYIGDDAFVQAVLDGMVRAKTIVADGRRVARLDFKPKLSVGLRKLKDRVVEAYRTAGFQPPDPATFAAHAGGNAANLKDLFDVCVAEGLLVAISDQVFLHADVEAQLRTKINARLSGNPGATVAEIRDLLGTTRKFAVPICEYLDRIQLTRRDGDLRVLS